MKRYYNEGWNAFNNNAFRKDNPYKRGTLEFKAWLEGFNDHYNDLDKYIHATSL